MKETKNFKVPLSCSNCQNLLSKAEVGIVHKALTKMAQDGEVLNFAWCNSPICLAEAKDRIQSHCVVKHLDFLSVVEVMQQATA